MSSRQTLEFLELEEDGKVVMLELRTLYPTVDAALAKIAGLKAQLTLPKGTIHVISDIHGEHRKLKHVINNASGSIRPLVEEVFGSELSEREKMRLLTFIYYPQESYAALLKECPEDRVRREQVHAVIRRQLEVLRRLTARYPLDEATRLFPEPYKAIFAELIFERELSRAESYVDTMLHEFSDQRKEIEFLRLCSRLIRNLSISELIVAGDLGDRGPRIDKVISFIMRQPRVRMTWGNHDASWIGACLGHLACIATVLRVSLRYRRLSQLEEGYGIPMIPLDHLARTVYGDDPAACFACKGEGLRDAATMARMQKAIAIIQFKLEGQVVNRNPSYGLEARNLLHRIDPEKGEVEIDGRRYPMRDRFFPTIDWRDPYALSSDEMKCMERLQQSFLQSPVLWDQVKFVMQRGGFHLVRDNHLIFHGCVPVDENGEYLPFTIDGTAYRGRALFEALEVAVHRAFRERSETDLDLFWYLWAGPLSPVFGKDRMATFETYFVEEKATHKEHKNPYFKLIHDPSFCRKILKEFGIEAEHGLIVNGHVPVKIEAGESPLKESGFAVTIDGAFSEAYGDKGYTLILDADKTRLAQHHHFESVDDAIHEGFDIIPTVTDLRVFDRPRTIADTERGEEIRQHIDLLERLIQAYRNNVIPETVVPRY